MVMGMRNPYLEAIEAKTLKSNHKNVITASCKCEEFNNTFYDGSTAEYYKDFKKAAFRFHFHKTMGTMFWGVHYRGKHIVGIGI